MMESDKTLVVSFKPSTESGKNAADQQLEKEISLDYSDDDIEMLSDTEESPKRGRGKERGNSIDGFAPVNDVEIFAVDESHLDTSGGEIRRKTKFDADEFAGPPNVKRYMNPKSNETDQFFNSEEQRTRRMERAKRFGLESTAVGSHSDTNMVDEPTPEMLSKLYGFFEINPENPHHKEKFRLDAVYLRGVNHLSTEQIFEHLGSYSPAYLEWIDDASCNLVWTDRMAAARALLGISKPLRRIRRSRSQEEDDKEGGDDVLSRSKRVSSRERRSGSRGPDEQLREKETDDSDVQRILESDEPISVDVGQFAVPPGVWRVGKLGQLDQLILVRFSTVDDVKGRDAQRKSRYYREHGNPNYGGQTGFISKSYMNRQSSRKRQWQGESQETRPSNRSLVSTDLRKTIVDRDRWNLLRDDMRRNSDLEPGELVEEQDTNTGEVKLIYYSSDDDDEGMRNLESERSKRPRMRMHADDEEEKKEDKRRRLRQLKRHADRRDGIEGDWRFAQRKTGHRDLRDILRESRVKITVPNDGASSKNDLRRRLGSRRESNGEDDDY